MAPQSPIITLALNTISVDNLSRKNPTLDPGLKFLHAIFFALNHHKSEIYQR